MDLLIIFLVLTQVMALFHRPTVFAPKHHKQKAGFIIRHHLFAILFWPLFCVDFLFPHFPLPFPPPSTTSESPWAVPVRAFQWVIVLLFLILYPISLALEISHSASDIFLLLTVLFFIGIGLWVFGSKWVLERILKNQFYLLVRPDSLFLKWELVRIFGGEE